MDEMIRDTEVENDSRSVCAVVVTRNRLALLQECVQAIREQSYSVAKILVIDNESEDGTTAWLASQCDLWVIRQANVGSAGGFHRGIKEAVTAGFSDVWVMDDDVVPWPDALAQLCKAACTVVPFGFLASRVVGTSGHPLNMPTLNKSALPNGSPAWPLHAGDGMLGIQTATFVSLLIPASVVVQMGLPIAEMFIWGDDTEYTTRLSTRFPCFWVLGSVVLHKRANQAHLDIIAENDPKRVRMFFWNYRNNMHVALRYRDYRKLLALLLLSSRQLFAALRSKHAVAKISVIVRGLASGCVFRPLIETVAAEKLHRNAL